MAGVLLCLVLVGLVLRVVYGLSRPHFWMFAGVSMLVILPAVVVVAVLSQSLHIGG